MGKKRPHLRVASSILTITISLKQREAIECLADIRETYMAELIRSAIDIYLAQPSVQAELAQQSTQPDPADAKTPQP